MGLVSSTVWEDRNLQERWDWKNYIARGRALKIDSFTPTSTSCFTRTTEKEYIIQSELEGGPEESYKSTRGDSVPRQGTCLDERKELHWVEKYQAWAFALVLGSQSLGQGRKQQEKKNQMKEQDSALCGGKRVSEALKMARIALIRRMVSSLKTGSQKEYLCERHKVKIMARTLRLQLIQMGFTEVSGEGRS